MPGESVTQKELRDALDNQADRLIAKMNRMEDSIKETVKEVKLDCQDDIDDLDDRVKSLEGEARKQTIVATAIASLSSIIVGGITATIAYLTAIGMNK